jgi:NAD-dependent deacetylase
MSKIDELGRMIADAKTIVAFTGAGISTESGIPDFRGPHGLWTTDPSAEARSTIDAWIGDPDMRREVWAHSAATREVVHEPNAAHRALVDLQRLGRLDLLVTQNVDGLHLDAGSDPARYVEVHGSARDVVCLGCGDRQPMPAVLDRVAAGEEDPHCLSCGGLLKRATILFGQPLVEADMARAQAAARTADVFLALGTSLAVYPVAWLPMLAHQAGAKVVIVNRQGTEQDDVADALLLGSLGVLLPDLVQRVRHRLA